MRRLAKYILRPPICLDRLEARPNSRFSYKLKTRWYDGTPHIMMERHELLVRLVLLIPPPRAHLARYYGILAPNVSGRGQLVPRLRRRDIQTRSDGVREVVWEPSRALRADVKRSSSRGDQDQQQSEERKFQIRNVKALDEHSVVSFERGPLVCARVREL